MSYRVAHHDAGDDREDDDERIEHRHVARLLEIVLSEECEVEREKHHYQQYVEGFATERELLLCGVGIASLVFFLERLDDTVFCLSDNLATVNDLLSFLCHAKSKRYALLHILETLVAALLVINYIRCNIVVEIALLQLATMLLKDVVEEELFVSLLCRKETHDGNRRGVLAVSHHDTLGGVFCQTAVFGRADDTCLVNLVKPVGDDADIVV